MTALLATLVWLCLGLQAYHYLGYPALLLILARVRPRPVARAPLTPPASLVIAAYNEAGVIADKLENALALDYPDLEVIVVAEGSSDRTLAVVEGFRHRGVVLMGGPARRGKSAALNAGAARARGEILVFSDANAFYDPGALRALAANFADPEVGVVSGTKTVARPGAAAAGEDEGVYWRYENLIKRLESRIGSTPATIGEMLAIRRDAFAPIPDGVVNDDAYLALATLARGYRVVVEPAARCTELPSPSLAADAARRKRMVAGRWQLLSELHLWPWQRPLVLWMLLSHKGLRLVLPLLMLGALAANLAVVALPDPPATMNATLAAQLAFYGLALIGLATERMGWRLKPARLALYVTAGNLSTLGGLVRHLRGRQTTLWEKPAR